MEIPKNKYDRLIAQDTEGNYRNLGIFNAEKEDVKITKKKPELTPKQKALLKNKTELTLYSEELGGYIHMYYVSNELLFNKVNIERANISRLIYLATYIDYNDRQENLLIKYSQCKEIEPMTRKDIKEKLGLKDTTFKSFLKNMKENNLLYEVNNKFYINPDYFSKGKIHVKDKKYTRIYINTTRILYEGCNPKKHKSLSYVFQLIPFMNTELNIICENPNEKDLNKIKKLNMKNICELLKLSTDKKNMSRIKKDILNISINYQEKELYLFRSVKIEGAFGSRDYFVINPNIAWGGINISALKEIINLYFFV